MPAVRFCSACGAELTSRPPVACEACGTSHYANPKPCANAVVVEHGKVLLARRALAPWQGLWGTPGGFCEAGEHPLETTEREVLEETGVRVEITGHLGVWVDRYADEPDEESEIINVAYYLAVPADGPRGAHDPVEIAEVAWFGWDELPRDLAPPGTLEAVLAAARAALEGRGARLPDRR